MAMRVARRAPSWPRPWRRRRAGRCSRLARADAPQLSRSSCTILLLGIERARQVSRAVGAQGRGGIGRPHPHRHFSFDAARRRAGCSCSIRRATASSILSGRRRATRRADSQRSNCSNCRSCRRAARWSARRRSRTLPPTNLKDEFREVHPICFSCTDRGVIHANRPMRTVEDVKGLDCTCKPVLPARRCSVLGATRRADADRAAAAGGHAARRRRLRHPWHMVPALKLERSAQGAHRFCRFALSTTTFVLAMNKASYERLPRDLKNGHRRQFRTARGRHGRHHVGYSSRGGRRHGGAARRSNRRAVAGSRRALAQGHRAGGRSVAQRR